MSKRQFSNIFKKKRNLIIICTVLIVSALLISLILLLVVFNEKHERTFDIESVEIQFNGEINKCFVSPIDGENISLTVLVNGGKINYSKYSRPNVKWAISGNDFGCVIQDGVLHLDSCDTLGQMTLLATVESKNVFTAEAAVNIIPKEGSVPQDIYVETNSVQFEFVEGQPFNNKLFEVWVDFEDYRAKITDYDTDIKVFSLEDRELQITYKNVNVTKTIIIPVSVAQKKLQSIEITKRPDKVIYVEGQKFDKEGMEVKANYEYVSQSITDYYFNEDKELTVDDFAITLYYSESHSVEGVITKTARQHIIVSARVLQGITVDAGEAKTNYVQGERFDPSNLIVTALYNIGQKEITDYTVDTYTKLVCGVDEWSITYEENGIEKKCAIDITVDAPYTNNRRIVVEDSPKEVRLTWSYAFTSDAGEDILDNTAYAEHNLTYDSQFGIYEVPVGAVITLEAVNPAILDFNFDGQPQGLEYPSRTLNFTLKNGEEALKISLNKINNRANLSFECGDTFIIFSYPKPWNGRLKESDLKTISEVFDENDIYYYNVYKTEDADLKYSDLSGHTFQYDAQIEVQRMPRENGEEIRLVYWEGVEVLTTVDKADGDWREYLPQLERTGYVFCGWVERDDKMIAQWQMKDAGYTGSFVGEWYCKKESEDGHSIAECFIKLNSAGNYEYTTYLNGEVNLQLFGFYSYEYTMDEITIISVETVDEILLVTCGDFEFVPHSLLDANLMIVEGYNIYSYQEQFIKLTAQN